MSRHLLAVCLLLSVSALAQTKTSTEAPSAADTSARLPVKRVVLYKNGVGYFEHSTHIHGNQDLTIDFTTAQLNDVLKSLTAVDMGEGRISSVRYNSTAPLDERLKALRLPFGSQLTRAEFLLAMRGARVEVRNGAATATGRLLSVESEQRTNDKTTYFVTTFSVVSDAGDMRNFELTPATSVRLLERDLSDEVGRYLNLVGSARARDLRRMTISDTGVGDREVFVSYISEVPIWKSTYRLILPTKPDEKPLLQGWAIVDNTVAEDWKDVQLSLVAGSPQSFIQQISQPYYARRPVVGLPQSVMLTPQAHEGTINEEQIQNLPLNGREFDRLEQFAQLQSPPGVAGGTSLRGTITDPSGSGVAGAHVTVRNEANGATRSAATDARGIYQIYGIEPGNSALFVEAQGFQSFRLSNFYIGTGRTNEINGQLRLGASTETVEVQAEATRVATSSAMVSELVGKQHIEAESKDLGDYFEYNLRQKITIGKNQSALVPILQAHIDAEKVSIWNEESKEIRRALWITNSSGLTLDSGTFNILDSDTFAGEGVIETVHPAERRLISYAADPALRISLDLDASEQAATHVRIAKGTMFLIRQRREARKYIVHNSDTQPREVVIEHSAREGWELVPGPKPEETTQSFLRFRLGVGPGKTENLEIAEAHPEQSEYELSDLDDKQVAVIVQQKQISPAMQDVFHRVLDQKSKVVALDAEIKLRKEELDGITRDQARLRENMKALKGSTEEKALLQRYTRQLDSQEDRLNTLNKDMGDLNDQRSKEDDALDTMIENINLDQDF